MKYGNLKYKLKGSFGITFDQEAIKPDNIFKYYALSKYNVDALLNGYLYASHPFDLNDILDSRLELLAISKKLDKQDYRVLYETLKEFKKTTSLNDFYNNDKTGRDFLVQLYHAVSSKLGIISLSADEFSPLIWPHYTNEKGFVVDFRTKKLEESLIRNKQTPKEAGELSYVGLERINYVDPLQVISINNRQEFNLALSILYNVKHKTWEYESEWRILVSRSWMGIPFSKVNNMPDWKAPYGSRNAYYDKDSINSITIGRHFFYSNIFNTPDLSQKIGDKHQVIFTFKKNSDLKDSEKKEKFNCQALLNYISSNSFKTFMSLHQTLESGEMVRAKEKIEIVQLEEETFKVIFYNIRLNKYSK